MPRLLALLLSLLLPAPALALELRHGPAQPGCVDASPKHDAAAHRWTGQLGGPETRRAWRALLEAGPHGCDAVAAWLQQGAPAAPDDEIAAAVLGLARRGSPENVDAAALALTHPSHAVAASALYGLRSRLPVLDRATAEAVVAAARRPWEGQQDAPDPRASALGLLLGRHAEGRVVAVQDGPVTEMRWTDSAHWSAEPLPPLHLEAAKALLDGADPAMERAFAELARAMVDEEHPGAPAIGPLLVPLLARGGPDRATAQIAAHALGRGQPPGIDDAVAFVLAQRNPPYLAPNLLDGFADRVQAGAEDAAMVERLTRLRALPLQRWGRRAERLRKRAERALR
jgi:hypothetical protein